MAIIELSKDEAKKRLRAEISAMQAQSNKPAQPAQGTSYNDIANEDDSKSPWFLERTATNLVDTSKSLNKQWWEAFQDKDSWFVDKAIRGASLGLQTAGALPGAIMQSAVQWDPTWISSTILWGINDVWNYVSTKGIQGYNTTAGKVLWEVSEDRAQDVTNIASTFLGWKTALKTTKLADSPVVQSAKRGLQAWTDKVVSTAKQYAPRATDITTKWLWKIQEVVWKTKDFVTWSELLNTVWGVAWNLAKWWLNLAYNPIWGTASFIGKWIQAFKSDFPIEDLQKATGKKFEGQDATNVQNGFERIVREHWEALIPSKWEGNIKNYSPAIEKIDASINSARESAWKNFQEVFDKAGIKNIDGLRTYLLQKAEQATWVVPKELKAVINKYVNPWMAVWQKDSPSNSITSETMNQIYSRLTQADEFKKWEAAIFFKNEVERLDSLKWKKAMDDLIATRDMIEAQNAIRSAIKQWEKWMSILTPMLFALMQALSPAGSMWNVVGAVGNTAIAGSDLINRKWFLMEKTIKNTASRLKKESPAEEAPKASDKFQEKKAKWLTEQKYDKKQEEKITVKKEVKDTKETTEKKWLTYTEKKKGLVEKPEKQKSKAQIDREFQAYQKKKIEDEAKAKKEQKVNRWKATKWLNELEKLVGVTVKKSSLSGKKQVADKEIARTKEIIDDLKVSASNEWIRKLNKLADEIDELNKAKKEQKADKVKKIKKGLADTMKWLGRLTWTMWPAWATEKEDNE